MLDALLLTWYSLCELLSFAKQQLSKLSSKPPTAGQRTIRYNSGQTTVSGQQFQHNHDAETMYDTPIPARAQCTACNHYMPVVRSVCIRVHGPCTNRCKGSGVQIFHDQLPRSVPQPDVSCTKPSSRAQSLHFNYLSHTSFAVRSVL